jgi:hypothetical protein
MANKYQPTGVQQRAYIPMGPAIALTAWSSLLTGVNTQAVGELGNIADEWRNFVGLRLKEDVAFLQRLRQSTGPDQVLAAYADFWRKAGEDYGNEIATMTKLATDMTNKMAVAGQSATEEANTKLFHREAA